MAKNIREAMHKDGKIYCIEIAEAQFQPEEELKLGFDKYGKKTKNYKNDPQGGNQRTH